MSDFRDWMESFDFEVPTRLFPHISLQRCNAMLSEFERAAILSAADSGNFLSLTEQYRYHAGYDRAAILAFDKQRNL